MFRGCGNSELEMDTVWASESVRSGPLAPSGPLGPSGSLGPSGPSGPSGTCSLSR